MLGNLHLEWLSVTDCNYKTTLLIVLRAVTVQQSPLLRLGDNQW